ncbi:tfdA [Symbiodinium sp. CCMP2592]|nr:tfdA [Symbiodinium sp. CCMP2592]
MAMPAKAWETTKGCKGLKQTCRHCRPTFANVADTIDACSRLTYWKPALALLEAVQESRISEVVLFNGVVMTLGRQLLWVAASELLAAARHWQIRTNQRSHVSALSALRRSKSGLTSPSPWSRSRASRWSLALHMARDVSIQGLVANVFVRSAVAGLCAEAGAWPVATLLAAAPSDSVLCNAAITASGRSRSWCHALLTLETMKTQLMELTAVTFTGLITATAGQALWDLSATGAAAASGPASDWPRGTALLATMAGHRLLSKEAVAAAATCCAKHWRKALYIFAYFDLHRRGEVDGVLAGAVINAMGTAHAWPEATSLLDSLPGPASGSLPGACNVLITACGRAMEVLKASALLSEMLKCGPQPDLISFNAYLAVAGSDWTSAFAALEQLRQRGLLPDRLTVNNCCVACGAARQWQKGLLLLDPTGPPWMQTGAVAFNSVMEACQQPEMVLALFHEMHALRRQNGSEIALSVSIRIFLLRQVIARAARFKKMKQEVPVSVTPLTSFAFAVKVDGLRLSSELDAGSLSLLRDLFEQYSVLVFKSAGLTDDELIGFARAFAAEFPGAELEASEGPAGGRVRKGSTRSSSSSTTRLIGRIANFDAATGCILASDDRLLKLRAGNGLWHIDSSFKVMPALASLMVGNIVVPPGSGGETEFASSRVAFNALTPAEQHELDRLLCVHDFRYSLGLTGCAARFLRRLPPARHFLVRHTPTGRSLFAGRHCSHIEGMSLQSGRALIRKINKHVTQERFIYRHSWSAGDLVICDNRSCVHRGRAWRNPAQIKRQISLVKIAEGRNEVASDLRSCRSLLRDMKLRPGPIAEAAPLPKEAEALAMLQAVGWEDLDASEGDGTMQLVLSAKFAEQSAQSKKWECWEKESAELLRFRLHLRCCMLQIINRPAKPSKTYWKKGCSRATRTYGTVTLALCRKGSDDALSSEAQTFGALVNAAVRVGDLSQARTWLQESRKQGVNPGVVAYTTLLKGLCEAGQIQEAQQALEDMLSSGCQPNIRTANTLLRGLRRAGEVEASLELLRRMEDEWGVPPDATSCEYAVALLCQGLRVKAARALLKRSLAQAAGAEGSAEGAEGSDAFVTWEGGKAAAFRNRASLWTMVAEASLLCNEPRVRARRALKRARLLRRKAAKWQKQERQPREAGPGASSAVLFAEFKERELARRAALIEDHLKSQNVLEAPAKHMTRLLALPQDIADPFLSTFLCDVLGSSVLPAPWSLCRDEHSGLFFWNQTSNETAWVHPLDAILRECMAAFQTCIQMPPNLRDQTLNTLQESWEAEITKLLFEWQQAEDDGGQVYYHNAEKQLSMWEHPSLVFLPRQYMREQALNRLRDLAYLERIGALASRGGSREIYQALKLSKMKIAEHMSVLSPKSKDLSLGRSATTDTVQSSLSDAQASKEQAPSKALQPESPSNPGSAPAAPVTPSETVAPMDDKASTAPARLIQRGIELERNNAAAKSVLRLAGDLLQANGNGQPIRQNHRSAFLRKPNQQRLAKSVSDGHIKFNWAKSSMDLQASLSLEEKAWWWPCAPKGDEACAVSGQTLLMELQRSFGLHGDQPKAEAKLLQRLNTIAGGGRQLKLDAAFDDVPKPLKVELCSGEGEWVCAQAAADAGKASWACVENRRDRVFRTFSRALLTGVCKNLCVVAADAAVFLRMLAPGSVAYVYVNFPEPPVRRGLGDGDIEGSGAAGLGDAAAPHLLTAETFRSVRRVLSSDGTLLIHSDNVTYLRQLAASLGAVGGFANVSDPGPGIVRDGASNSSPNGIAVWRGRPGIEAGVPDPEASSYFDRLWSHGRFTRRYFILVRREEKIRASMPWTRFRSFLQQSNTQKCFFLPQRKPRLRHNDSPLLQLASATSGCFPTP